MASFLRKRRREGSLSYQILVLVFALLLPSQASANHRIQGRVLDESDAVVTLCRVMLFDESGKRVEEVQTDSSGNFRLSVAQPGRYRLEAESSGLDKAVQWVRVPQGATEVVTLRLRVPQTQFQLTVEDEVGRVSTQADA